MTEALNVLIMAGQRAGEADAVAAAAGVSCKAFAPVAGQPMLERVIAALRGSAAPLGRLVVVLPLETPRAGEAPGIAAAIAAGLLDVSPAAQTLSASVLAALPRFADDAPLLITTADHALLTPAMLDIFLTGARSGGDAAVAVVPLSVLTARYPELRRTRLNFRDGAYKGGNLFYFAKGRQARAVLAFWQRLEAQRKSPWRMMRTLGPRFLLRYLLRRLTLADAMAKLGRLTATDIRPVIVPIAEAGLDVDTPADLAFIRRLAGEL